MVKPVLEIEYCPRCGWLARSAWMAQEVLSTFAEELGGVTLKPSETGGVFEITCAGVAVWSRKNDGGFPDIAELKRRVRDIVAPGRPLGHVEKPS
jgi:selenoprotein W-related protein